MAEHGERSTWPGRSEELVALYDPDDPTGRVVGAVSRSRMRSENLPHAATSVILRRRDGRVLVHRRADSKDLWPSLHDLACGGVIAAGESPEECALRELSEEVGVVAGRADLPLRPLLTTWYRDNQTHGLIHLYEAMWDGDVRFADGEVAEAWWMTEAEVGDLLADPRRPVVPDTRALMAMIADPVPDEGPLPPGAAAVYRFGRGGRARSVLPATVIEDGPEELVLWIAEGTPTVREVLADGRDPREAALTERATAPRVRAGGLWRSHGIYMRIPARPTGWALWHFFEPVGTFAGWYGNLEAPQVRRRTALGTHLIDTADRALDVWVPSADGAPAPQWKDEDEFAAFTDQPGRWSTDQVPTIRAAGERFIALARAGSPPFDGRWTMPPADPLPIASLPPDWDLPHVAGP